MELDLHIHSQYSFDSLSKPSKILDHAVKKGLDGISITDHNSMDGSIEAIRCSRDDIIVIPGMEISTEVGHVIGLFLSEEIRSRVFLEVIDEIKNQDGISVLAHPFKRASIVENSIIEKVGAIEAFNSRANTIKKSDANLLSANLAKSSNLAVTAGSDAHFYFEIGRGRLNLELSEGADLCEIKKAILSGKSNVNGIESSPNIEVASQIIKYAKSRKLPKASSILNYLGK